MLSGVQGKELRVWGKVKAYRLFVGDGGMNFPISAPT